MSAIVYYSFQTGNTSIDNEGHIPAFFKKSPFNLEKDKFDVFCDILTSGKVQLMISSVITSITFNKLDNIIISRLRLGRAGTRMLRTFI